MPLSILAKRQNFYTISKCYWLQYAYANSSARPYNCTSFWFLVFGFNRVLLAGCGQAGIKIFSDLYLVIYI